MKEVYGTIRKLGATSKYKGYYFVAEAIRMTMEFQEDHKGHLSKAGKEI